MAEATVRRTTERRRWGGGGNRSGRDRRHDNEVRAVGRGADRQHGCCVRSEGGKGGPQGHLGRHHDAQMRAVGGDADRRLKPTPSPSPAEPPLASPPAPRAADHRDQQRPSRPLHSCRRGRRFQGRPDDRPPALPRAQRAADRALAVEPPRPSSPAESTNPGPPTNTPPPSRAAPTARRHPRLPADFRGQKFAHVASDLEIRDLGELHRTEIRGV